MKNLTRAAAVFLFIVLPLVPAVALDFSAGGGLALNTLFVFAEFDGVTSNESATGLGIHGFADVTYAEISAGVIVYEDTTYLSGTFLLKYPVNFADTWIFPLAGAEYRWNLDYEEANTVIIKGGVGADIVLSDQLFLRPELLLGYAFLTKLEENRIDAYEDFGGGTITKMTLDISASAGYRF